MKPLVTVAIPTLNRPEYLRATLLAVQAQDYANLEILVSDNGSTDDTAVLVQEMIMNDPRATWRKNRETVPSYIHFTQCLEAAKGEFFVLLCDDDLINARFVSELVNVAVRNPGVNAVVPANATIDENGKLIAALAEADREVVDGAEFICEYWLHRSSPKVLINLASFLGRTEVLRHFGGYQAFARGQNIDNLLFLQCAITGRVGFARGALFSWRVYPESLGSTSLSKDVASASAQFLRYVRRDPATRMAMHCVPGVTRARILNGLQLMTTREYLSRVGFFEDPLAWRSIRSLFEFRWTRAFWYVVVRQYCCLLRDGCRFFA